VTWNNRPGTTGAPATSASGSGWRSWTVTSLVQSMYSAANDGFVLKDQTEGVGSFRQNYASREDAPNDPQLVVNWG
jgi:large repetitive protein